MFVTFEWHVPNQILKVILPVQFTDAVARQYDTDIITYLDSAPQPIHVIIDMHSADGKTLPSTKTLLGFKHARHPNLGHIVIIGLSTNPLYRFLASIMLRVLGLKMRDASSEEEALSYLETVAKRP